MVSRSIHIEYQVGVRCLPNKTSQFSLTMKTFEQFYNEHNESTIRSIAYKLGYKCEHHAQDLAHDVMLKVFKHYDKYDGANDKGWLGFIINNTIIDYWRRNNKRPTISMTLTDEGEYYPMKDRSAPIEEAMIKEDELDKLQECIALLNEDFIHVMEQVVLGDLTHKQYAEKANISINTSLGRARYAIKALKKMMAVNYS